MKQPDYSHLYEYKGLCPICDRAMYDNGTSINRHHLIPKSKGGKATQLLHIVCHRKIHSLFTEKQCAREYADPEIIRAHPDMQKFIQWVSKKDPLYYDNSISTNEKRRKR